MTFIKYLQRRTYDILSDKPLIVFIVVILVVFFVLCQVYEIYILSSREFFRVVCDNTCCHNIGSTWSSCEPIDAVYTWVNGSDPQWFEEMKKVADIEDINLADDFDPSRYDDKFELKYSLRSLELYAPWIRKVYIVTAGQLPWWLEVQNPKLKLITHEDIIPKEYLPTFSSPAIECFIHKIPNLSQKFLYLNDDIFLGAPLHLSDLYSATDGYIVYTSWNVPDCTPGCPWSFLGDRSCDSSCNNPQCDYDGGDCTSIPKHQHRGIANQEVQNEYVGNYQDSAFFDDDEDDKNQYDGKYPGLGDPSFDSKIVETVHRNNGEVHKENSQIDVNMIRSDIEDNFWGVNNMIVDSSNIDDIKKPMRRLNSVHVSMDHTQQNTMLKKMIDPYLHLKIPIKEVKNISDKTGINNIPNNSKENNLLSVLLKIDKNKVNISGAVNRFNKMYLKTDKKIRKIRNFSNNINEETKHIDNRKLPMYAKSLIYTNKILNKVYSFQNRKVPAHVPFLMEKKIIEELQIKFKEHIILTAKHKFRRADDFQFAFSYYHYLLSEKQERSIEEIFDLYDTDKSGTWSDREVRTVLARVRGLPLTLEAVRALEAAARNCDKEIYRSHPTPPHERYLDSEMPTLTKDLILECEAIKKPLVSALGTKQPRAVIWSAAQRHTFAMLESNVSKAVNILDEIRRDTKKFICINDNLDPSREEESAVVRMMLQELYEALLPMPSSFELPQGVGNRFLRLSDLLEWQNGRQKAWIGLTFCATLLFLLFIFHINSFFKRMIHRLKYIF